MAKALGHVGENASFALAQRPMSCHPTRAPVDPKGRAGGGVILLLNLGQGPERTVQPLASGYVRATKNDEPVSHCLKPSLSLTRAPVHPPPSPDPEFTPTHLYPTETAPRPPTDSVPITECLQHRTTFTAVGGHRRVKNQSLVSLHVIT